jgi:hypothetical protein
MARNTEWKLRLEESELADWKAMAALEGITLSEWVRRRCNGDEPVTRAVELKPPSKPVEAVKAVSGCAHGVAKGWRCTLCGGIVK